MKEYQVYSIDAEGKVVGNRVIEAATDDDVIFSVRSMQRHLNTEVWHRDRRIARVPGRPGING
jgi:hypothetical protein